MPALNFKKQFVNAIESGQKSQTIRATRKYPIRSDDKLYLYTGMRTKQCRKLAEATCTMVRKIKMSECGVKVDGQALYPGSIKQLAEADGFQTVDEFRQFFRDNHGFPFHGQIIVWGDWRQ